jgi:hypothetical protein
VTALVFDFAFCFLLALVLVSVLASFLFFIFLDIFELLDFDGLVSFFNFLVF